jgi:hypothetical protein
VDFDIKRGRILTQVAGNQEEDFFGQRSTGAELRPPAVRRSWLAPLRFPFLVRESPVLGLFAFVLARCRLGCTLLLLLLRLGLR